MLLSLLLAFLSISNAQAITFAVDDTSDQVDLVPGDGVCAVSVTEQGDPPASCTLRAAIQEANALAGADLITLPAGVFTLSLTGAAEDAALTGDLDISDDLEISGAGLEETVLDGAQGDRVLHVAPSGEDISLRVADLTLRNGSAEGFGGGIYHGAGVLILDRIRMTQNTTSATGPSSGFGGGIYIAQGSVTLSNSLLDGNSAIGSALDTESKTGFGGGIYLAFREDPQHNDLSGSLAIVESVLRSNRAQSVGTSTDSGLGGGLYLASGHVDVDASTLHENTATGENFLYMSGGAILNKKADLRIRNSTFSSNHIELPFELGATEVFRFTGGGLAQGPSLLELSNNTFWGNDRIAVYAPFSEQDFAAASYRLRNNVITQSSDLIPAALEADPLHLDCILRDSTSLGYNLISVTDYCAFSPGEDLGDQFGEALTPVDAVLAELADNGGPTPTHAPLDASPALDAGDPAGCVDHEEFPIDLDQRGEVRPFEPPAASGIEPRCDIGALELQRVPEPSLWSLQACGLLSLFAFSTIRNRRAHL